MSGTGAARLPRRVTRAVSTLTMAVVVAACSASASGTPTVSPTPTATATPSPSVTATASAPATPPAAPTATPAASAASRFSPPAGWTTPLAVGPALACATYAESPVAVVIDASSGDHAAFACDGLIRLMESRDEARTWATSSVPLPSGEKDLDPQLAVDGTTLYVAYTRVVPAEGCGSNGATDVSVWYRTRPLSGGAWSAPRQIGASGDHLDALRVVGGTVYLAIHDGEEMSYETLRGATYHRYTIRHSASDAAAALRVGDDGKARVAYEDYDAVNDSSTIGYGVFTGTGFSTSVIPGSDEGWGPVFVLGQGDTAYVLWNRSPAPGGCVTRDPEPSDGTYFSTNAGGTWQTSRLAPNVGEAALTVDVSTGQVHVLVSGAEANTCCPLEPGSLLYLTEPAVGPWTQTTLLPDEVQSPMIKLDTATGTLLVMYAVTAAGGVSQIYVMTRP